MIDHINGDGLDNRWCNLREADSSKNTMNCARRRDNTTGVKGIFTIRGGKLFRAEVCVNGVRYTKHSVDLSKLEEWVRETREKHHRNFAHH